MSNETLVDRLEGGDYWLPGIGAVTVVPPGGVRWDQPADLSFGRGHTGRGVLTAAEFRSRYHGSAVALPPIDVPGGGGFVSCVSCATVPKFKRCSGCPRGGVRLNVRRRTEPIPERKPRRWLRWRKD
jgi:hypothetical protein